MRLVLAVTVQFEPGSGGTVPAPGLHAQNELAVPKGLSPVVEQDGIDPVTKWIVHARRDEGVDVAVGVQISGAEPPGPVVLGPDLVGDFPESALTLVEIERIPVDALLARNGQARRSPSHLRLELLEEGSDVFAHVRMHVGQKDIHAPVVVEIEDLDPHRAPGGRGKQLPALLDELPALDVLVVLVVALHVQDVEVGPPIPVDVDGIGVAAPTFIDESQSLGDLLEPAIAQVPVEEALLRTLRPQVPPEGILHPDEVTSPADLVGGVHAHIGHEQVQEAVSIVIEEHASG